MEDRGSHQTLLSMAASAGLVRPRPRPGSCHPYRGRERIVGDVGVRVRHGVASLASLPPHLLSGLAPLSLVYR